MSGIISKVTGVICGLEDTGTVTLYKLSYMMEMNQYAF